VAKENKFYVTTPIYYVTAKPHLGTLYSTVLADIAARWNQIAGKKTFFLTGTDEHGQKVEQAAIAAGKDPKKFVDSFIPAYKDLWKEYELDFNYFIRTTDPDHVKAVQKWITLLIEKGDIYKSKYQGLYCSPCETFVTEKDAVVDCGKFLCPDCKRECTFVEEESYFFRLSAYQDKILKFFEENPNFITPKDRINEVISFVKSGLKDLSVSRTTVKWGVPFPNDPNHVAYVWLDALSNYITAIGFGKEGQEKEFDFWWPADLQILGKDIVRFHAVYWLAFLMATDLPLPKKMLVHGWIRVNKQKMSKSFGNVIDPKDLLDKYGAEPVRYYLARKIAVTQDSEFSIEDLEKTISADLANELGNLLNRMTTLAFKNELQVVCAPNIWSESAMELRQECWDTIEEVELHMQDYMFHMAYARLWKLVNKANAYFHSQEPWKLARTEKEAFNECISCICHVLRAVAIILWPVMPKKMEQLLQSLGIQFELSKNLLQELSEDVWNTEFKLMKIDNLFEKYDIQEVAVENKEILNSVEQKIENYIQIDDFAKIDLLVGTILECEIVEGSDKLLKMQVDFGEKGKRQIFAGVKKFYSPTELIGKQGVFVANLKPRKIMGMESQGMMLFAESEDGKLQMTTISGLVPNGTKLR